MEILKKQIIEYLIFQKLEKISIIVNQFKIFNNELKYSGSLKFSNFIKH